MNPGALSGKKVLITRAAGTSDEFAAKLREAGAEPFLAPVIAIGPPDDEAGAVLERVSGHFDQKFADPVR